MFGSGAPLCTTSVALGRRCRRLSAGARSLATGEDATGAWLLGLALALTTGARMASSSEIAALLSPARGAPDPNTYMPPPRFSPRAYSRSWLAALMLTGNHTTEEPKPPRERGLAFKMFTVELDTLLMVRRLLHQAGYGTGETNHDGLHVLMGAEIRAATRAADLAVDAAKQASSAGGEPSKIMEARDWRLRQRASSCISSADSSTPSSRKIYVRSPKRCAP